MTGKLVLENLKHRPMRSLLSILLIGVPVTLILCLVGLSNGFIEDSQRRQSGIGADIVIRPKSSSLLSLNAAPIPEQLVAYVAKQPHVTMATGVFSVTVEGVTLGAAGINYDEFAKMSGGVRFLQGGPFQHPDDVILDDYYAEQTKAKVGDIITLLNTKWRVCGIMESGKLSHILLPIDTLRERNGNTGNVNQIYATVDRPANIQPVIDYLKSPAGRMEDYPIFPMKEFISAAQREQHSGAVRIHRRGHGHRCGHRLRRRLPLDVHGRAAAHPRDRNPEESRRIQGLHSGHHPERGAVPGDRRHHPRHPHELRRRPA